MTRFVRIDGRESIATSQPCDLRTVGEQKGIRHQDKDTVLIASLFGNDGFDLGGFVNRCCNCLHSKGWGSGFEDDQIIFGIWRGCRVEQEGDPVDARCNLFEHLQPLPGYRGLHQGGPGDVAARPRQARHEAAADRKLAKLGELTKGGHPAKIATHYPFFERRFYTTKTPSSHTPDPNPALPQAPDLILANPV